MKKFNIGSKGWNCRLRTKTTINNISTNHARFPFNGEMRWAHLAMPSRKECGGGVITVSVAGSGHQMPFRVSIDVPPTNRRCSWNCLVSHHFYTFKGSRAAPSFNTLWRTVQRFSTTQKVVRSCTVISNLRMPPVLKSGILISQTLPSHGRDLPRGRRDGVKRGEHRQTMSKVE